MKFHPHLITSVTGILLEWMKTGRYIDQLIESDFRGNKRRGANDRRFIAQMTYDAVRYWRLLWTVAGKEPTPDPESIHTILAVLFLIKDKSIPSLREFTGLTVDDYKKRYEESLTDRSLRESIPEWLDQYGVAQLQERWDAEAAAMNDPAPVVIRVNLLKTDLASLRAELAEEGVETTESDLADAGLVLTERKNVFALPQFRDGKFEVQDTASQLVAPFMEVQPGMRVIDACAGAGGKTLHIATLMRNKGRVIAMDVSEAKLQELKRRHRRQGIDIIQTRQIVTQKDIQRLSEGADRVLLDVPCSGSGVIRRNPDTKWKLTLEKIGLLIQEQREILTRYSRMVKPGGKLIYATCSLFPAENQENVAFFLQHHPEFLLETESVLTPASMGTDGFYMARLKRL